MEGACRKNENIVFSHEVRSVDYTNVFHVTTNSMTITADNIAVGVVVHPAVPPSAALHLGTRQFHVTEFLTKAEDLARLRVGVLADGESAPHSCPHLRS